MHKSRLAAIILDSQVDDIKTSKKFWTNALGIDSGDPNYENDEWVPLEIQKGQPHIWLHKVNHPSRVHIDIETDNIPAEVSRLKSLGATVFEEKEKFIVMEAPTGHRFCVVNPQRNVFETSEQVNVWE